MTRARLATRPPPASLDDFLQRIGEELNAASCRRDITDILHFYNEWIARLSERSRAQLLEVVQDIINNKNLTD